MVLLALDLSTKTGYAVFDNGTLTHYGQVDVKIEDFNVNDRPEKASSYPWNILTAVSSMMNHIQELVNKFNPDFIAVENTCGRSRNRNTQRVLEFLHYGFLQLLIHNNLQNKFKYLDVSEWRKITNLRLTKEDKKKNKDVKSGKCKGRITSKHLSVRQANQLFNLKLKLKDNNASDAIMLGFAYLEQTKSLSS